MHLEIFFIISSVIFVCRIIHVKKTLLKIIVKYLSVCVARATISCFAFICI